MADPGARELKLTQYLNEAYGKEKQLETTLQAQIGLAKAAARKTLQKRLQDHLKETKAQSRGLERRIKQLGGKAEAVNLPGPDVVSEAASGVANVANRALAAAKGPVQALRGTSPADNLLRNVRDAVWNEAEEIAHYDAIEALAETLNDKDTAKLAREFRRQEERMQKFLRGQIAQLVKQVVKDEVPAAERRANGGASRRRRTSRSSGSRSTSRSSGSSSRSSTSSSGSSSRSSGSSSRSSGGSRGKSSGGSRAKSSGGSRAKSSGSSSRSRASSSGSSSRSSGSTSRRSSGSSSGGSSRSKSPGSSSRRSSSRRSSGGGSSSGGSGSSS
jgi:ferritin-like metal-binding protein YciE